MPDVPRAIDNANVDRVEFHCRLEWWANSTTLLGCPEVAVVVTASGSELVGHGRLVSEDDDDHEGFVFLCEMDPVFTMRFDDGQALPVTVTVHHLENDGRRFCVGRVSRANDRPIDFQIDL